MELWIRSQDKETLKLAEMLDIYDLSDDEGQCWAIEESGTTIGYYKSKKRALEVLDEIQQKLKNLIYLKPNTLLKLEELKAAKEYFEQINKQEFVTCDCNFEIIPFSTNVIVYEMPKE